MYSSIALLSLLPFVSCAAISKGASTAANSWQISDVATHFMGDNSGIASGAWPPGTEFNSTISFTVSQNFANTTDEDAPTAVACSAQWVPQGTGSQGYPTSYVPCGDTGSGTSWKFENTTGMNEGLAGGFIIDVKMNGISGGKAHVYTGSMDVTSASSTDSSMTCLGGAPLTGVHCTGGPFTVPVKSDKATS